MNLKYNQCSKQWIVVTPLGAEIPFRNLHDAEDFIDHLQNTADPPERADTVERSTHSRWVCFFSLYLTTDNIQMPARNSQRR